MHKVPTVYNKLCKMTQFLVNKSVFIHDCILQANMIQIKICQCFLLLFSIIEGEGKNLSPIYDLIYNYSKYQIFDRILKYFPDKIMKC